MLAWLLLFGGASISLRCVWDFIVRGDGTPAPIDPPRQLVIAGLYKYTRNPMYVGVLTVIVAEAILSSSLALLAYAGLLFLCFHAFVVFYEEPALQRRFGEDYAAYCGRVPRWVGRHISPNTRT